jgi:hypothetical protein
MPSASGDSAIRPAASRMRSPLAMLVVLTALQAFAAPLGAQIGLASAPRSVQLTATKRASVGIALPGGSAASLPGGLLDGPNDFAPLPVVTTWNVDPARTAAVTLAAFFDAPERALAGTDGAIPASHVFGRVATGGPKSFAPFTGPAVVSGSGMVAVAGGTLVLFAQPISSANAVGGRRDELQVRIDLSGLADLPPGSYSGTLNLVATTQ